MNSSLFIDGLNENVPLHFFPGTGACRRGGTGGGHCKRRRTPETENFPRDWSNGQNIRVMKSDVRKMLRTIGLRCTCTMILQK